MGSASIWQGESSRAVTIKILDDSRWLMLVYKRS
jgi:hypothetical protein